MKKEYIIERSENLLEFHIFAVEKGRMTKDLIAIFFEEDDANEYMVFKQTQIHMNNKKEGG